MVSKLHFSIIAFLFLFFISASVNAQNNLQLKFKDASSAPQNLTVCGGASEVTVVVSLDPNGTAIAKQINASVSLFKGMRFVSFNGAGSSAGVSLINGSNLFKPVFGIPDLSQNGLKSVQISFSIEADCRYVDTLSLNDQLLVLDKWDFSYLNEFNAPNLETDYTSEYRDALKLPYISMTINNPVNKPNAGDVFYREVKVSNSGLVGFLKNFTYENIQGAGVSIQGLKINGSIVPLNKTPLPSGDTLISAYIDGSIFVNNTIGIGNPGNGDQLLDPDELVTIIETVVLDNCTKSRTSVHRASWGCNSETCASVQQNDVIQIAQGVIYVDFKPFGSIPDVNAGYCQTGTSSVRFTNVGVEVDAGTAMMFDISTGIGLGNDLMTSNNGFKIVGLTIAGVTIPVNQIESAVDLNNNPLFTVDPDGFGGLTDADGDGYYDDLPNNEYYEITIQYEIDCSFPMVVKNQKFCTNNLTTSFHGRLNYTNFCNERTEFTTNSYFGPVNLNDSFEDCSDPDAFTDGSTFYIMHNEIRNVFNFEKNCNGEEQFIATVILPQGITPVLNEISLHRLSEVFPLINSNQNGDTLFLYFDASLNPFLNGTYTLNLAFKADCQAIPGKSIFPVNFQFYCPPCDCKHPFYCNDIIGPVIHYYNPPCPPNSLYACEEGLRTLAFDVNRTSLGYKDKNYTIPITAAEANTKAAISCDIIQMNVLSIVGQNPINDSLGVEIRYSNVDKTFSNIETFLFRDAVIRITHNGTSFIENVPKNFLQIVNQDSLKLLKFNLHNLLKSSGFTLVANDTVELIANFSLNPDGPYPTPFKKVPNFRAKAYHIVDGVAYNCDDNGEIFEIGKTKNGFSYPNSGNFPKGCQESYLEYSLIQVNNGYIDVFPNEYRPAAKVDSLEFTYDPLVLDAYTLFQPEVLIPGHPIHGNNYFNVPQFDNSGSYMIRFDTLDYIPSLNVVGSYAFSFRIKAVPNCKALSGSSAGTSRFDFDPTLHYKGRYYASQIGNGDCVDDQHTYVDDDIQYQDPPIISFAPEGNSNVVVINDTAVWTVRMCNTSQYGNAGITWLSLESPANNDFKIASMIDITDPNSPVNLLVNPFGVNNEKFFAFDEGLTTTQNGAALLDDVCNIIQIKAKVKDCGATPFVAKAGWNCLPYTDPNWNPEQYEPCSEMILGLAVVSNDPFLDANFVNQNVNGESICDTAQLEILIRNVDVGKAYDIKTILTLPLQGTTFVPGSVEVAYPSNSAFVPALTDPVFTGVSLKGNTYEYADFSGLSTELDQNGLDGFVANNPTTTNEFRIRFKYIMDCEFNSGSFAYHSFSGISGCGQPTNIELGESLPILIEGLQLASPKSYMVSIDPNSNIIPDGVSQIGVTVMNQLDTPTDASDVVSVKLPLGLSYVPGSSIATDPINWFIQDPQQSNVNGFTILNWVMPSGIGKNGKVSFNFSVSATGITCDAGALDIGVETLVEKDLNCNLNNSVCNFNIITSDGGTNFFSLPVIPPSITIESSATNVECSGEPVVLVAKGASNYVWTDAITGAVYGFGDTLKVTPTSETTYRVDGGLGSCASFALITITTLLDTESPVILNAPADITILCTDPLPPPAVLTATDDCDKDVEITFDEQSLQLDSCKLLVIRTWTAKDDLGNTTVAQQNIVRIDNSAPVITLLDPIFAGHVDGDTIIVECSNPPLMSADDASVTDDCDLNPTIKFIDLAAFKGNCEDQGFYLLMYCAWSATDHCGNESKIRFFFKFIDNDPPLLHDVPVDITINESDPVPAPPIVYATDKCDQSPVVSYNQTSVKQDCNTILTRTWTGSDECGNKTTANQTITILGQQGPISITGVPDDITIECDATVPAPVNPVATGKCGGLINITLFESMNQANPCLKIITRIWTATDISGSTETAQQTITIIDSTPPVITFNYPVLIGHVDGDTITLDCFNPPVFDENDASVTDNCDQNPVLQFIDLAVHKGICPIDGYKLLMYCEWFAQDNCGNSSSVKLYFKFIDNTPPVISFTDPLLIGHASGDTLNFDCKTQINFDDSDVSVTDACDLAPVLVFQDLGSSTTLCTTIKHIKWITTDSCGNSSFVELFLKFTDSEKPVIDFNDALLLGHASGDTLKFDCSSPVAFDVTDASASDNCDQNVSINFQELNNTQTGCTLLKHYRWTATDDCGNTSSIDIYVLFTDTTPPVLVNVPSNLELDFGAVIPQPANVTATDNCDLQVNISFSETIDTVNCEVFIKRTWLATDDCSNTSSASQTIKIKCYVCIQPDLSNITVVDATCNSNGSVTITQANPEKFNYTWSPDSGTPNGIGNSRSDLPPGSYSVIVSDKLDESCNKKVTINISKPDCNDTLYLSGLNINNIDTCLNALIDITPITSLSICQQDANEAVFVLNGNSPCIKIVPNSDFTGTTTMCLIYCNGTFCDTIIIVLNLKYIPCPNFIAASTQILHPAICINGAKLCVEIPFNEIGKYSITQNGLNYNGGYESCSASGSSGTSLTFPEGQYQLIFTNEKGCKDSMNLNVICTQASVFYDTILINTKKTYTLDQSELLGPGAGIFDLTPNPNPDIVLFEANYNVFGIDYSGINLGSTSAVFSYTDELGTFDTAYLHITVIEDDKVIPIDAVDDNRTTKKNQKLEFNVVDNDHYNKKIELLELIDQPIHGQIALTDLGVVTYIPDKDYCGKDQFSYRLCDYTGCDAATVNVEVICKGIIIYNGFTPNGDGKNDCFFIDGIEEYPGNTLKVFNRWGQQVYSVQDYQNDWKGTWEDNILPDGTYFYFLEISDKEKYTGYLQIQR